MRAAGLADIRPQYEAIAAALNYETTAGREQPVRVTDIGGGTADFLLVHGGGPQRCGRAERKDDILASHGSSLAATRKMPGSNPGMP